MRNLRREDVRRLSALGLLSASEVQSEESASLASLCAAGVLQGGLSVALDVRPDELVGPLCQRLGGDALRLRILEVRASPQELWVRIDETQARWRVPDVPALVRALNLAYRRVVKVRAIACLGVWDEAWQLWCLEKATLPKLLEEDLLQAENMDELSALGPG